MVDGAVTSEPVHLVLYDGSCGVCQHTVQWILAADPAGAIHFAPLQGATAAALRARHPDLPTDRDSVLYVDRSDGTERVFARSEAIFRLASRLARPPRWLAWAAWLPRRLTDLGYRIVARNRHRLSGALACPILPETARVRFLP
jgi:predicted DCC family thiol-disulfide oxidoreductase YuxK